MKSRLRKNGRNIMATCKKSSIFNVATLKCFGWLSDSIDGDEMERINLRVRKIPPSGILSGERNDYDRGGS